ncbi:hypothetical protein ACFSC6_00845 [Rufibacter sediminis]|uniref:Major facilitator superfamily (MFS) profile domain-containing protein n=1 Tax=Rufibacter sediminis TaxID=2762756 RepID=A0ABR6VLT2_9BACT|nr:hypothetical protein [Rufibacter sediminis]MBC3538103.1 hypothetical protein [Rufibacter sediminis]
MFRSILAVLGGAAIGVFTISLVEYMSHQLFSLPAAVSPPEAASGSLNDAPTAALLLVLLGYALGSFFGGMVAARFGQHRRILLAVLVGLFLLAAGIANLATFSHPLWFTVVSVVIYLPMAYFGGMMSVRRIP